MIVEFDSRRLVVDQHRQRRVRRRADAAVADRLARAIVAVERERQVANLQPVAVFQRWRPWISWPLTNVPLRLCRSSTKKSPFSLAGSARAAG